MKELRHFINHCTHDDEFWNNGGIPTKEKQYIEAIGLTEDELAEFYDAMCKLQRLNKKIKLQRLNKKIKLQRLNKKIEARRVLD